MRLIRYLCKICIDYHMLVEQCALMHMLFKNDLGVRLLEYVR